MKPLAPVIEARVGRILQKLAKWLAYCGGIVLSAAALTTVISIIGRAAIPLGLGPVPGDFELVKMATVVAVFAFLPWSQIHRGQVTVDIVVDAFSPRLRAFLGMLGDLAMTLAAGVIAWRLWLGMGERIPFGSDTMRQILHLGSKPYYTETTFILHMPVWWGYALAMIGAGFFAVVCLYTFWRALNWTLSGQEGATE